MNIKKLSAEAIGTAWLVFGGCGSAVIAAGFPDVGIGLMGVSFAFGLTVLTMAFAIGPISGCHLNPAVTIGLAVAGKHPRNEILPYIAAQIVGGIIGAGILYLIVTGKPGSEVGRFATNGYGEFSPGEYGMGAVMMIEMVCTAFFLFVILGSTSPKANPSFAPISIGLCLTLIHLISIPVSNTSVNPVRSLAPALYAGMPYLSQVWLFWVAPIIGACIGAMVYKFVNDESHVEIPTQIKVHKESFVARHLRKA